MVIRLHLNEVPFPPSPLVGEYLREYSKVINRYSYEELMHELLNEVSKYTGIDENNLSIYPSSSEILITALKYVAKRNLRFLMMRPSFHAVYEFAELENVKVYTSNLNPPEFVLDSDKLLNTIDSRTVLYISNPNNPTSNILLRDKGLIEELCRHVHMLILDEAYYEFSGITFIDLIETSCNNLIIVRTFSKAFALAGARIGYLASSREIVEKLNKLRPLFDVPIPSMAAALAALHDLSYMRKIVNNVKKLRDKLAKDIKGHIGLNVLPSATNFLFIKLPLSGEYIAKKLKERNILTMYFKDPIIRNYLRASIGTENENKIFIEELKRILENIKPS